MNCPSIKFKKENSDEKCLERAVTKNNTKAVTKNNTKAQQANNVSSTFTTLGTLGTFSNIKFGPP